MAARPLSDHESLEQWVGGLAGPWLRVATQAPQNPVAGELRILDHCAAMAACRALSTRAPLSAVPAAKMATEA